jgi:hypothetical protein
VGSSVQDLLIEKIAEKGTVGGAFLLMVASKNYLPNITTAYAVWQTFFE